MHTCSSSAPFLAFLGCKTQYYVCLDVTGGVDYDSGPYTVTFTAGQTSVPFDVPVNNDNTLENTEMFTVTIDPSTLPDHVTVNYPDQSTVTILDSDSKCTLFM